VHLSHRRPVFSGVSGEVSGEVCPLARLETGPKLKVRPADCLLARAEDSLRQLCANLRPANTSLIGRRAQSGLVGALGRRRSCKEAARKLQGSREGAEEWGQRGGARGEMIGVPSGGLLVGLFVLLLSFLLPFCLAGRPSLRVSSVGHRSGLRGPIKSSSGAVLHLGQQLCSLAFWQTGRLADWHSSTLAAVQVCRLAALKVGLGEGECELAVCMADWKLAAHLSAHFTQAKDGPQSARSVHFVHCEFCIVHCARCALCIVNSVQCAVCAQCFVRASAGLLLLALLFTAKKWPSTYPPFPVSNSGRLLSMLNSRVSSHSDTIQQQQHATGRLSAVVGQPTGSEEIKIPLPRGRGARRVGARERRAKEREPRGEPSGRRRVASRARLGAPLVP